MSTEESDTVGFIKKTDNFPKHQDVGLSPNNLTSLPMSQFASFPQGQAQWLLSAGLGLGRGHMTNAVGGMTSPQDSSPGGPVEGLGAPSNLDLKHLSSSEPPKSQAL